jgi:hypothetical protein
MPLPINPEVPKRQKSSGPRPTCECGTCPICRNRQRQRRYYLRTVKGVDDEVELTLLETLNRVTESDV